VAEGKALPLKGNDFHLISPVPGPLGEALSQQTGIAAGSETGGDDQNFFTHHGSSLLMMEIQKRFPAGGVLLTPGGNSAGYFRPPPKGCGGAVSQQAAPSFGFCDFIVTPLNFNNKYL